jgi:hypothetical protein
MSTQISRDSQFATRTGRDSYECVTSGKSRTESIPGMKENSLKKLWTSREKNYDPQILRKVERELVHDRLKEQASSVARDSAAIIFRDG